MASKRKKRRVKRAPSPKAILSSKTLSPTGKRTNLLIPFAGHVLDIDPTGKMTVRRDYINTRTPGDYGADPIGDGTFRMVPSGDVVDYEERNRRLAARRMT